jgi:hypothetical protein
VIRPSARLLILASILAAGCGPGPSPLPSGSPAIAPPTLAATRAEAGPGWTLVGVGNAVADTQIAAIAPAERGFVAVGSAGQAGEIAMAWSTGDGITWTPEDIPSRGTSPRAILPWEDRFLVIGGGSSNRCAHPGEIDTWVRRPDGSWLEAPFQDVFCGANGLTPLLRDTHAWIIGNGFGEVPTALDSAEGLTWTNRSAALGDIQILAAGVDETGLWISGRAGDTGRPDVRTSPDGRHWTSVDVSSVGLTDAPDLLMLPGGIALMGPTNRGPALVRRAGDAWQPEAIRGLEGLFLRRIHPAGAGLVAIADREDGSSALLVSADGATWQPVGAPAEVGPTPTLTDVAVGRSLVVLAGQVPGATADDHAAGGVWTAPLSILEP